VSATQSVILTREDAVKTQLDTAIWLWFIEEQIGPIHALADNALTILNDIGGKVGKESQLYSKAMHEVHGRDRLKGFSNFLKHGSKDANAAYKFPLLWTEGLMLDAICTHWAAGRLNREEADKYPPKGVTLEEIAPLGRREFLETVLPLFAQGGFKQS